MIGLAAILSLMVALPACRPRTTLLDLNPHGIHAFIDAPEGVVVENAQSQGQGTAVPVSFVQLRGPGARWVMVVLQNTGTSWTVADAIETQLAVMAEFDPQPQPLVVEEDCHIYAFENDGYRTYEIYRAMAIPDGIIGFYASANDEATAREVLDVMRSAF